MFVWFELSCYRQYERVIAGQKQRRMKVIGLMQNLLVSFTQGIGGYLRFFYTESLVMHSTTKGSHFKLQRANCLSRNSAGIWIAWLLLRGGNLVFAPLDCWKWPHGRRLKVPGETYWKNESKLSCDQTFVVMAGCMFVCRRKGTCFRNLCNAAVLNIKTRKRAKITGW